MSEIKMTCNPLPHQIGVRIDSNPEGRVVGYDPDKPGAERTVEGHWYGMIKDGESLNKVPAELAVGPDLTATDVTNRCFKPVIHDHQKATTAQIHSGQAVMQLGPDGITEVPLADFDSRVAPYQHTTLHPGELESMQSTPQLLNHHIAKHHTGSINAFTKHHGLKSRQSVYNWISEGAMWWNDDVWTNKKLHNV